MKAPPGIEASVFVHAGQWTFDVLVTKAPHMRRQGTNARWNRDAAERAAMLWANRMLADCRPRVAIDERCDGR